MHEFMPDLSTASLELKAREPLFHRPEFGTSRPDFERMMTDEFFEVGASGNRYSRSFVLDTLELRHRDHVIEDFKTTGFQCHQLAPGIFLVTYVLEMAGRTTRRSTIWKWDCGHWRVAYHQGTPTGNPQAETTRTATDKAGADASNS